MLKQIQFKAFKNWFSVETPVPWDFKVYTNLHGAQEHPYTKLEEQNVLGKAFFMLFCDSGSTWIALGWLHEELDAEDPSRFPTAPIKPLHLRLATPSGRTIKERP